MGTKVKNSLLMVTAVLLMFSCLTILSESDPTGRLATSGLSGHVGAAKEEGRGMWVVRDQITSPEKVKNVVATATKYGYNFIVVQVVGRGDAYYKSTVLPRSEALDGQPASFDPLKLVIDLAHAKGIKVIAWLNDMYLCGFSATPVSKAHLRNTHPEWVTYTSLGKSMIEAGQSATGPEVEGLFLDPGIPEVKEHIVARYSEIVKNYKVDGVHHDYIRYSNPNLGYNPIACAKFKEMYGYDPLDLKSKAQDIKKEIGIAKYLDLTKAWDQFRRDNITAIVKAVYEAVKAINPKVEVSGAVIGYYKLAYSEKFQDWKLWLEEGYLDVAMPMIYEPQTLVANYMVDQALAMQGKGVIFPGLGAYTQTKDLPALIEKVQHVREQGGKGFLFFDYGTMYETPGYFEGITKALFTEPATYPKVLD